MTLWNGLIARYCPSLDATGNGTTTLYNLNGNGIPVGSNNGTLINMDAATDWIVDTSNGGTRALDLDGFDDYILPSVDMGLPSDFTITAWVYPRNISQTTGGFSQDWIFANYGSNTNNLILLFINNNGTLNLIVRDGAGVSQSVSVAITQDTWHFVAARRSGAEFYVRASTNESTATNASVGSPVVNDGTLPSIGAAYLPSTSQYLNGRLDDICIFNVAKSPEDIAILASRRGVITTNLQEARLSNLDVEVYGFTGYEQEARLSNLDVEVYGFTGYEQEARLSNLDVEVYGFTGYEQEARLSNLDVEVYGSIEEPIYNETTNGSVIVGGFAIVNSSSDDIFDENSFGGVKAQGRAEANVRANVEFLWNPISISPRLWFDAADSSTLFNATSGGSLPANNSEVARWEDKSGNARHLTQSTSNLRPLRITSAINSLDVIRFSNDHLQSLSALNVNGLTQMTIVSVCIPGVLDNTTNMNNSGLGFPESGGWGIVGQLVLRNRTNFRFGTGQGGNDNYYTRPNPINSITLTISDKNNSVDRNFINGTLVQTQSGKLSTINATSSNLFVGGLVESSSYWLGDKCEILIFDRILTLSERQLLEGYLSSKWGMLDNLPSNHPYKNGLNFENFENLNIFTHNEIASGGVLVSDKDKVFKILFLDGWELDQSNKKWGSYSKKQSLITTNGRYFGNAMQFGTNSNNEPDVLFTPYLNNNNSWLLGFNIKKLANGVFLRAYDGNIIQLEFRINNNDILVYRGGETLIHTFFDAIVGNDWQHIQIKFNINTNGFVYLRNENSHVAPFGRNLNTGYNRVNRFMLTSSLDVIDSVSWVIDDFWVSSMNDTTNNVWLGALKIESINTNGYGYQNDWENYGNFIRSVDTNDIVSYTLNNINNISSNIKAVSLETNLSKGGPCDIATSRTFIKLDNKIIKREEIDILKNNKIHYEIFESNPNDNNWELEDFQNLEIGVQSIERSVKNYTLVSSGGLVVNR